MNMNALMRVDSDAARARSAERRCVAWAVLAMLLALCLAVAIAWLVEVKSSTKANEGNQGGPIGSETSFPSFPSVKMFSSRLHTAGDEVARAVHSFRPELREAARGAAVAVPAAGNSVQKCRTPNAERRTSEPIALRDLFQFRAGEPVLVRIDAGADAHEPHEATEISAAGISQKATKETKGGGA